MQRFRSWFLLPLAALITTIAVLPLPAQRPFSDRVAQTQVARAWGLLPRTLERIQPPFIQDSVFLITDYGAQNDSTLDSHRAIYDAIVACNRAGGGRVVIPKGVFLSTSPIKLRDNVELHLADSARLVFEFSREKFSPLDRVRYDGILVWNYTPFIYAYQRRNIALTGKGEIDARAKDLATEWALQSGLDLERIRAYRLDTVPLEGRIFGSGILDRDYDDRDDEGLGDGQLHYLRPALISFVDCRNVLVSDLTLRNSPYWTVHPVFSRDVVLRNLRMYGLAPDRAGVCVDGSSQVLVTNCYFEGPGDAFQLAAGSGQPSVDRPATQQVILRRCTLRTNGNAFGIGPYTAAGIRDIFIEDAYILDAGHALRITGSELGSIERIYLRNVTADTVRSGVLQIKGPGASAPPLQEVYVQNWQTRVSQGPGLQILGNIDNPIQKLWLESIRIREAGDGNVAEGTKGVLAREVSINGVEWNPPPRQD